MGSSSAIDQQAFGTNGRRSVTSVPSFDQLMWPAIISLRDLGGSGSNDELLSKVIEVIAIPDDVASIIHTDNRQTKLSYNLAWAKTYLRKAGYLENSSRGVWSLTEAGENLEEEQIAAIPAAVRKEDYNRRRDEGIGQPILNEDTTDLAGENQEVEQHWKAVLLSTLQAMKPDAFERLAQRILRESGFSRVEVTGRSGDGGIDGTGILKTNLLLSFTTLFQCKRYVGTVGASAVRDFRGAMVGRSDKGIIITTGTFSADARREATRDGAPPIDLVDGDSLCDLLKSLGLGVRTELIERVIIDQAWVEAV